jgi:GNAT superfamily N-acetyltransferase
VPYHAVEDLAEAMAPVDLLLVEGFKRHPYPKIEVHRPAIGKPLLCADDPYVIAVATDGPLPVSSLPILDLNDAAAIAEFILRQVRTLARDDVATGYTIRPAQPEDAPRLPDIERDGAEAFRAFGMTAVAELPPATAEQYRAPIEAGRVWVAVDASGEVVGFAEVSLVDGRPHLAEIDVLRAHRRRGVGRSLIAAVAAWAREAGYAELTLTTFRDVPMNGPLYARLGFVPLRPGLDRPELAAIRDAEHRSGVETSPRIAMRLVL